MSRSSAESERSSGSLDNKKGASKSKRVNYTPNKSPHGIKHGRKKSNSTTTRVVAEQSKTISPGQTSRKARNNDRSDYSTSTAENEVCNKFPLRQRETVQRPTSRSRSRSVSTAKTASTRSINTTRMEDEYLVSPRNHKSFKYSSDRRDRSPERLVIENKVVGDRGGLCNGIFSCLASKRIIVLIVIYALIATGLGAFLFNRSWSLFDNEKVIAKLEEQVDLLDKETQVLEAQVDRLEDQVVKLGNETDRLEIINDSLKETAHDLNETIAQYEDANGDIGESVNIYKELNEELSGSLAEATAINDILSDSVSALEIEVTFLKNLEMNLTDTINTIERQNSNYEAVIADLQSSNVESKRQIEILEEGITRLKDQNDELDASNENLVSILTFMKQTGIDLNTTVDDLTKFLGNEINQNAILVLMSLEISYQNIYKYWTELGPFDDLFGKKGWTIYKDSPIGSNDYEKLMEYIEEYVSSEVCANIGDFENFLMNDPVIGYSGDAPPVDISFKSMKSGVERYFSALMVHYFSFGRDGVSKHQWMEAEFDCQNLAEELRFKWS